VISALDHPLVADYLRGLDSALAGLPPTAAAELSEQIRAHLLEALPPDADEDAVAAVLAALGPASLVAAAAGVPGPGADGGQAWRGRPLRRLVARARRVPAFVWLVVAAIVVAVAVPSGALIFWHAQPGLRMEYSFSWWNGPRVVTTYAAGATQETQRILPGKVQGFAVWVYNPSDMTQVITGSADHVSPGAPVTPRIAVSTTGPWRKMGEPHAVRYRMGGPIPPHSFRWVRVLWRSAHCYLAAGGSQGTSDLRLRVRVGWITRTEDIQLGAEIAVAATKASVAADAAYCRTHQPGS